MNNHENVSEIEDAIENSVFKENVCSTHYQWVNLVKKQCWMSSIIQWKNVYTMFTTAQQRINALTGSGSQSYRTTSMFEEQLWHLEQQDGSL